MSGSDTALGGSSSLPGEPPAVSSIAMPGKPSYPTVSSSTSEPLDDDESAIDTERAKELLEFLRSSPKHYNYDFTPEVRYEILRKITACLLNNVETVLDMVPIDPRSGRAPMLPPEEEDIPTEYTEVRRGKPCGHVFKPGEGVYRCKDCGFDDTCVMCSYCFKTTDHEGHDTSFCVNSGTGGCCDCGDPDAWQVKLVCQYHGTKEELAAVGKKPIINRASSAAIPGYREDECPEPIAMSIRETVAAVCEFMLETMATSPRIHKRVHREEEIIDDMVQTSRILGVPDDETLYSVVLWNDETHSFHDVIDLCMAILGCDKNRARVITENVHRHGREVIKTSSDLSMLLTISELLSKESIYVSIRSARDVFREQLSAALLLWLQDIAQGSYRQLARVCRSKVNDKIRYEVSRQLCTPWVLPRRNPALAESLVPIIAPPMYFEYDDMYEDIASNYTPFEPSQFGADMSSNNNNAQNNHAAAVLGFRASASTTDPTELEDASPAHPQQQQQQQQQAGQTTQLRGLRRLRSDSTDSLRQQGEERGSPRNHPQLNSPISTRVAAASDAPAAMTAVTTAVNPHVDQGHPISTPTTITTTTTTTTTTTDAAAADATAAATQNTNANIGSIWHHEGDDGPSVASMLASGSQSVATALNATRDRITELMNVSLPLEAARQHSSAPGAYPTSNPPRAADAQPPDLLHQGRPAGREDGGDVSDSDRMNDDLEYYGDELDENEDEFSIEDDEEMDSRAAMMHDALLNEIISKNTCRGRVDWFMLFDLALWKEVRSGLRELYMATMMLDPDYKIRIAIAFARNYPNICRSFLDKDRSPEHSVLLFSVQLFPAQTITETLVREHRFLYSIIDVLCKFFPVPTPPPLLRNGIILCDTEPFRNRRYFHAFHDMRYLVATPVVSKWVANTHEFLMNYVNFIKLFQGMNPIRRAATEHIEFESDEWINAFNVTLQVAKSCRQYAECFVGNPRTTLLSVRTILRETYHDAMKLSEENFAWHILKLQEQNEGSFDDIIVPPHAVLTEPLKHNTKVATTIGGIRYTIIDYDVTTNPVSFHHPLHWFITQFLQHASTFDDNVAKRYGFESLQELVLSAIDPSYDVLLTGNVDESKDADRYNLPRFNLESAKMQLLTIFDYSVRVCALIAQIHVDFWIRNGRTLKIQGSHYQDVSLRENTYDQDVALIQFFFCIWDDQDQILLTLIDRFRLIEWMSDFPNLHRYVYDPAQTIRIVEEFLNLLIAIVGERHVLSGCEAMELANREVIHAAVEPLPFSVITKKIPERLALLPDFESVVHKHAVFKEPTIHSTTGKYEVKDEYLDEIDPYFVHYPRQEREKIKELLWKRLKDRAQQPGSKYTLPKLLVPKPLPIKTGMFTRLSLILHTPLACDFLFYSLANSAMFSHTPASDTIIDEALYLIMLALEDAKRPEVVEKLGVVDGIRGGLWHYSLKRVLPLQGTEGYNLVGVLVTLYSRQQLKAWWPQIEYILDTLREGGATLSQVIDEYLRLTKKDKSDPEEEIRRKKELAKQRQAQLLAELQNQQKNFMDQFGLDLDDTDDDLDGDADLDIMDDAGIAAAVATPTDGEHGNTRGTVSGGKATRVRKLLWDTGSETCITCQGACDSSAPFGLLGLVQPSRLIRHTPMQYADTVLKILTENPSLDTTVESCADNWPKGRYRERMTHGLTHAEIAHFSDIPADYVTGGEASGAHGSIGGFPSHYQSRGIYASTCNHMMHVSCFLQYYSAVEAAQQAQLTRNHPESLARLEFMCPLCRTLGNTLIPVLPRYQGYDPLTKIEGQELGSDSHEDALFEEWLDTEWRAFCNMVHGSVPETNCVLQIEAGNAADHASALTSVALEPLYQRRPAHEQQREADVDSGDPSFNLAGVLPQVISLTSDYLLNPQQLLVDGWKNIISRIVGDQQSPRGQASLEGGRNYVYSIERYVVHSSPELTQYLESRYPSGSTDINTLSAASLLAEFPSRDYLRDQYAHYKLMYDRMAKIFSDAREGNHAGLMHTKHFEHLLKDESLDVRDSGLASNASKQQQQQQQQNGDSRDVATEEAQGTAEPQGGSQHRSLSSLISDINLNSIHNNINTSIQAIARSIPTIGSTSTAAVTIINAVTAMLNHVSGTSSTKDKDTLGLSSVQSKTGQPLFNRDLETLYAYTLSCIEVRYRGVRPPEKFYTGDPRKVLSGTWIDSLSHVQCTLLKTISTAASAHYKYSLITQNHSVLANIKISDYPAPFAGSSPTQETLVDISKAIAPLTPGTTGGAGRYKQDALTAYWEGRLKQSLESDELPWRPHLMHDQFQMLVKLGFTAVNIHDVNLWHVVRLTFTAELVKACVAVADGILGQFVGVPEEIRSKWVFPKANASEKPSKCWAENVRIQDPETLKFVLDGPHGEVYAELGPGIVDLLVWMVQRLGCDDQILHGKLRKSVHPAMVAKLVLTLVTPFLRRAAGFIHTAYGLDLAQDTPWLEAARQEAKASARRSILDPDKELEVKRLLYILRLPSLEALLLAPVREPAKHAHTVGLIEGWLDQLRRFRGRHKSFVSVGSGYTMTIPIGMPTYFTLLDFPQQFEVLFELSSKAICPNCQSIPEDSALCLMCGRFLCCQSFCCERDGIGECNVHMKTCGGTMGLFLLVKKCGLAFLYHDNGCFRATPFLDQHGEFDMGLRRGRPLFLNAERYNKLRQTLLDHQLPSTIARDIDPEFNIGGWITL